MAIQHTITYITQSATLMIHLESTNTCWILKMPTEWVYLHHLNLNRSMKQQMKINQPVHQVPVAERWRWVQWVMLQIFNLWMLCLTQLMVMHTSFIKLNLILQTLLLMLRNTRRLKPLIIWGEMKSTHDTLSKNPVSSSRAENLACHHVQRRTSLPWTRPTPLLTTITSSTRRST